MSGGDWGKGKTRHQRGYGWRWIKLRKVILARDSYLCQRCLANGRVTPATHVDHILRKAAGGTDDPANLRALCAPCHSRKTIEEKGHRVRPTIGPDGWPIEEQD